MAEEKKDPSESDKMDIETKEVTPEKAEAKTEKKTESKESGVEQKEPSKGCTLVVKNLTGNTNEAHLREIFRNYGIVKRVRVNRRDGTAISQGIGYVEMSTKEEATTALEYMDGAQIDGVVVSVGIVYESPFDAKVEHRKRSRAGEVVLSTPSFWDMCLSFLQLTAVIWMSILVLYGCSRLLLLWHRWQRKMAMRRITTIPYKLKESEECPICLEDFKEGEPVKRLPCGHLFHAACVKEWIVDVRGVCPLCRQGIFTKDACSEGSRSELNTLVNAEVERLHSKTLVSFFLLVFVLFLLSAILFS
ncbi:hypothetical protein AV274_6453 [Blastocystis sp. ATCC 50177/Nand II]|uniref:Uncharacterized protein n=1 Tax=Blastocystis sp. subtype 1 (strain ATCC 50177 / NandII) TaxID=478820 RepID=A0A196S3V9_BLAHN|nr:hypothetical protein AV274_6453 [Blastocystis sp. ATCC 50177/Nand II]